MRSYARSFFQVWSIKTFYLARNKITKTLPQNAFILNLSESEVTELANFMGHDKTIHKSHYRQSIPELDIPRFSRLLNVAIFNEENDKDDEEIQQNLSENLIGSTESLNANDYDINNNISPPKKKRRSSKYTFSIIFLFF